MSLEERGVVARDPDIQRGELVFAGTRVPVAILIEWIVEGDPVSELVQSYPSVAQWQVDAIRDTMFQGGAEP